MRYLILPLLLAALSGCALLSDDSGGTELVVKYATLKTCDTPERAARCAEIAAEVRTYATDTEYLTVPLLMAAVGDQINWQALDPADTLLVQALLDQLQTGLVDYLGADPLPEDLRLAVTTVADWVIAATALVR